MPAPKNNTASNSSTASGNTQPAPEATTTTTTTAAGTTTTTAGTGAGTRPTRARWTEEEDAIFLHVLLDILHREIDEYLVDEALNAA
ncbi:uncharacterized protein LOC62_03G004370 [Vanrija pseudolonga]|uniref:Uncharacterized protein n=1 Tax=Vanrija pseudolonga TaxID=143232 RepID=A0AAF0Y6G9_9TREE|nr:hypothetical protein LOC62_03G004370 [Vanrija pseudolonga]